MVNLAATLFLNSMEARESRPAAMRGVDGDTVWPMTCAAIAESSYKTCRLEDVEACCSPLSVLVLISYNIWYASLEKQFSIDTCKSVSCDIYSVKQCGQQQSLMLLIRSDRAGQ